MKYENVIFYNIIQTIKMSSSGQQNLVLPPTTYLFLTNKFMLVSKFIWPSDMHYLLGCFIILSGVCKQDHKCFPAFVSKTVVIPKIRVILIFEAFWWKSKNNANTLSIHLSAFQCSTTLMKKWLPCLVKFDFIRLRFLFNNNQSEH